MTTVTIHQPNFMPWADYFEKMREVDIFVFLTQCQFEKGGYQNRFAFDGSWHTMSTSHRLRPICQKVYLSPFEDWEIIKRALPDYPLEIFDNNIGFDLARTNTAIVKRIAGMLRMDTEIRYDFATTLTGTDRLVDICQHYGADTYLSGPSGRSYLDLDKFKAVGIDVKFHDTKDTRPILKVLRASV